MINENEKHVLHKAIGALLQSKISESYELILDQACGGCQQIPLFSSTEKSTFFWGSPLIINSSFSLNWSLVLNRIRTEEVVYGVNKNQPESPAPTHYHTGKFYKCFHFHFF